MKQKISGVIVLASVLGMVYSIWKMIPYGLSGEIGKAKLWLGLMGLSFLAGLLSGVVYYYFRSNSRGNGGLDPLSVEINTLASLGQITKDPAKKDGDRPAS